MHFEDFSSFIEMGGYGLFVWLSFAAAMMSVMTVWLDSVLTKRRLFKQVLQEQARLQRIKMSKVSKDMTKAITGQEN